jgi:hypothetical protein
VARAATIGGHECCLGLRSAWRRPGRLLTNAIGLSLAVSMMVVAAGLRPSLARLAAADSTSAPPGEALSAGAVDHPYEQVRTIVLGTAGLLLVLATINALIIAALSARDSARNRATLQAVGATPRQTTATLVVSQMGACLVAVALGLPPCAAGDLGEADPPPRTRGRCGPSLAGPHLDPVLKVTRTTRVAASRQVQERVQERVQ